MKRKTRTGPSVEEPVPVKKKEVKNEKNNTKVRKKLIEIYAQLKFFSNSAKGVHMVVVDSASLHT